MRQTPPVSATKAAESGKRELQGRRAGSSLRDLMARRDVVIQVEDTGTLVRLETLGARLEYARLYRRLSRLQLARAAGYLSDTTVRRYETPGAVAQPQIRVVSRFAEALGCDHIWLMVGRGAPNWQERRRDARSRT
jgi:hypothetical protein